MFAEVSVLTHGPTRRPTGCNHSGYSCIAKWANVVFTCSLVCGTTAADTVTAGSLRLKDESVGLESGVAGDGGCGFGAEALDHTHVMASVTKQSQGLGR